MNATITLDDSIRTVWDAIVIGAGPAGSVAACALARHGAKVLLVDKAGFPRAKVCGGCVSAGAVELLRRAGLAHVLADAPPLHALHWHYGTREIELPLPAGAVVSRATFDAALAAQAVAAGVSFLPHTSARLDELAADTRLVTLRQGSSVRYASGRIILAADGLCGTFLQHVPHLHPTVASRSWMGLGTVLPCISNTLCSTGVVRMICTPRGYVGLARVDDGQVNIAAALDPALLRSAKGPAATIQRMLRGAGLAPPDLRAARWRGVGLLTRRRRTVGVPHVLLLGDAAGYVEPFTGEGMAWAMASALDVVPLALRAIAGWREELIHQWTERQRMLLSPHQRACHLITAALRWPMLAVGAMRILQHVPAAGRRLVGALHAPLRIGGEPWA